MMSAVNGMSVMSVQRIDALSVNALLKPAKMYTLKGAFRLHASCQF